MRMLGVARLAYVVHSSQSCTCILVYRVAVEHSHKLIPFKGIECLTTKYPLFILMNLPTLEQSTTPHVYVGACGEPQARRCPA